MLKLISTIVGLDPMPFISVKTGVRAIIAEKEVLSRADAIFEGVQNASEALVKRTKSDDMVSEELKPYLRNTGGL